MSDAVLQAQIDIDAPPARVWALISDLSQMKRWSPQCRVMKPLGPVQAGTRTLNLNRRGFQVWPTTCKLTEVSFEKKLAFRVNENNTIWSYELESTETGTRVTETRRSDDGGIKPVSNMLVNAIMGGVPSFERELIDGMNQSLSRIKAAAEG
jgi:uncharacterized protein YndB with AHSA1/START domain